MHMCSHGGGCDIGNMVQYHLIGLVFIITASAYISGMEADIIGGRLIHSRMFFKTGNQIYCPNILITLGITDS